jgi:glucose-6-phosphate isomerase
VGLFLDYSKNRVTDETLKLLLQLAEESGLHERANAMFRGEKINATAAPHSRRTCRCLWGCFQFGTATSSAPRQ